MIALNIIMIVIAIIIPLFVLLNSWRKAMLAKARLQIAENVTEMEKLMLAGELRSGDVSHDFLFQVMQNIQYADRYEVNWKLLRKPTPRMEQLREQLDKEMEEEDCVFSAYVRKFSAAYYRAFKFKHPCESFCYTQYLMILKGGLMILLRSLNSLSNLINIVCIFNEWQKEMRVWKRSDYFVMSETANLRTRVIRKSFAGGSELAAA